MSNDLEDLRAFTAKTYLLKKAAEEKKAASILKDSMEKQRLEKLEQGGFKNTLEVYLAEGMDLVVEKPLLVIVTSVVLLMSIYFMLPI